MELNVCVSVCAYSLSRNMFNIAIVVVACVVARKQIFMCSTDHRTMFVFIHLFTTFAWFMSLLHNLLMLNSIVLFLSLFFIFFSSFVSLAHFIVFLLFVERAQIQFKWRARYPQITGALNSWRFQMVPSFSFSLISPAREKNYNRMVFSVVVWPFHSDRMVGAREHNNQNTKNRICRIVSILLGSMCRSVRF